MPENGSTNVKIVLCKLSNGYAGIVSGEAGSGYAGKWQYECQNRIM
jgi:hypothetical protein